MKIFCILATLMLSNCLPHNINYELLQPGHILVIQQNEWTYFKKIDSMTGEITYEAQCDNVRDFNFLIPEKLQKTRVQLNVIGDKDKPHIVCFFITHANNFQSFFHFKQTTLRTKFNQTFTTFPVKTYGDSYSSLCLEDSEEEFVSSLAITQQLTVELWFYDWGTENYTFNVQGFNWNYFKTTK